MDERREYRRLVIRLPVECIPADGPRDGALRAITTNISTGGVYFEVELTDGTPAPQPAGLLNLDLTVPPGEGHFPYEGRVSSLAEVVRCEPLDSDTSKSLDASRRLGIAARFREPLKLDF